MNRLTIKHLCYPALEDVRKLLLRIADKLPYAGELLTRKVTISRPVKGKPDEFEQVQLEVPSGDFGLKLRRKGGTIQVELFKP